MYFNPTIMSVDCIGYMRPSQFILNIVLNLSYSLHSFYNWFSLVDFHFILFYFVDFILKYVLNQQSAHLLGCFVKSIHINLLCFWLSAEEITKSYRPRYTYLFAVVMFKKFKAENPILLTARKHFTKNVWMISLYMFKAAVHVIWTEEQRQITPVHFRETMKRLF